jgi:glutamyl-tRNA reductase
MHDSARSELKRYRKRLGNLTPEQESAVEQLLLKTVNKIAHPILYGLRRSHETGATEFAEILHSMLDGNEQ